MNRRSLLAAIGLSPLAAVAPKMSGAMTGESVDGMVMAPRNLVLATREADVEEAVISSELGNHIHCRVTAVRLRAADGSVMAEYAPA